MIDSSLIHIGQLILFPCDSWEWDGQFSYQQSDFFLLKTKVQSYNKLWIFSPATLLFLISSLLHCYLCYAISDSELDHLQFFLHPPTPKICFKSQPSPLTSSSLCCCVFYIIRVHQLNQKRSKRKLPQEKLIKSALSSVCVSVLRERPKIIFPFLYNVRQFQMLGNLSLHFSPDLLLN